MYSATVSKRLKNCCGCILNCQMIILKENAFRLALLIRTAVEQHGISGEVIAAGGFLKNEMFRKMVEEQAGVKMTIPELPSVYGACVEAMRADGMTIPESFHQKFLNSYHMIAE